MRHYPTLSERIRSNTKTNDTGCLLWTGVKGSRGYVKITYLNRTYNLHRLIAIMYMGLDVLDETKVVMHTCDNKHCVNQEHLKIGTQSENVIDSVEKGIQGQVKKTQCSNGHPYNEENTYIRPDGKGRDCLICRRQRSNN